MLIFDLETGEWKEGLARLAAGLALPRTQMK